LFVNYTVCSKYQPENPPPKEWQTKMAATRVVESSDLSQNLKNFVIFRQQFFCLMNTLFHKNNTWDIRVEMKVETIQHNNLQRSADC